MAANLRALRRRIRSTQSTKKIFSAQELIAGARIVRAQARVEASKPYAREITRVLSALAQSASLDHPMLTHRENPRRAAVLVIATFFVVINLMVDLLYYAVDPRLRLDRAAAH